MDRGRCFLELGNKSGGEGENLKKKRGGLD